LLFCGKLDALDIPAIGELTQMGLCKLPTYLPPWVHDPRYLLALLTYSNFMSEIDLPALTDIAKRLLADTPVIAL
jgi:hypothetical protein